MKQRNLLIISAHADDHVACAGTIFKLRKKFGFTPYEIVLTNSELGQNFKINSEISVSQVAKTRAKELSRASRFLGINESFTLNQLDLGLTYSREVMFQVVKIIRDVRPQIVFLHNPYDAHPDHKTAFEIGINSLKIAATGVKKETLGSPFRVPLVLCAEGMLPIKSQILVDITEFMDQKIKLFQLYASQASPKAISFEKGLTIVRGYHLRKENSSFAEAFTLQEEFPVLYFEDTIL